MTEEVRALAKDSQISPQKARLLADEIRGLPVGRALAILSLSPKKGARLIEKVLKSAIANAEQNHGMDVDELLVSTARVDAAQTLKRWRPKGMGRIRRRYKRRSHLMVAVAERG
ncbi:MAG: 50S ribosomal protein L22 [Zetaproteobacteria bacterium CG11_big_fil_rev_8_21_14_0_20_59_439]|nr:MAG: 50S ribosomal protein L22 [Zetaproteobacteria bacterium CG2_30_59_37]PIQ65056.1 MAG: 50S ribosomal protein L22 [Zetaproteobacteria bacterium CG11_big_fil_rev_8_21_14_0_20_59_439]PIU96164.1 MAG: 50S ribosomal protein L22 [Zetaproteobacteria bacterium CG03_land_8_20_14_0_80_59_51]PJC17992.1 MAG: 50S ribosomal protein L22 [Zetaproteobacteria bacterium CG_4_9_14_0_2_um_filter_59_191]PJC70252.1 MAG: 50S ribosomal protein L22 [Zetaproteobacteria bacterium CG_4_8_14_3_um_filter_59_5]